MIFVQDGKLESITNAPAAAETTILDKVVHGPQDPHATAWHRGTSAAPRLLVRPRCSGRAGGPERWRGTASSKF